MYWADPHLILYSVNFRYSVPLQNPLYPPREYSIQMGPAKQKRQPNAPNRGEGWVAGTLWGGGSAF